MSLGVVGTLASIGLAGWQSAAAIAAGFGTAIYTVTWAVLAILRHRSKAKDPDK